MDLQDGLKELDRAAGDAVVGVPTPPSGDLWERGERWQRRRRRGSLAMAVLGAALLVALSAVTFQRAAAPEPAVSPGSAPTLPDRVYDVSPWLSVGAPGEVVVAAQQTMRRTWTGQVPAIAVITGSGRYVYLDVDEVSEQGDPALSPDGRRVAWWTTGTPQGTPHTSQGQVVPVTGIAVLDTVTGTLRQHDFPTEHGIQPDALLWADGDTLLGGFGQWKTGDDGPVDQQNMGLGAPSWRWDVTGPDAPTALDIPGLDNFAEAEGDRVLIGRRLYDLSTGAVRRIPVRGGTGWMGTPGSNAVLAADGTLAQVGGRGMAEKMPNVVTIARIDDSRGVQREVPGTTETAQVLGWRDGQHLVVARRPTSSPASGSDAFVLASVDVRDGASEVLVSGGMDVLAWAWASDLLSRPVVDGIEPADPMDPRVVTGLGLALVVGTVGGLVLWRRRARP